MAISGWKLDHEERKKLLKRFPPRWPDVLADHITYVVYSHRHVSLPNQTSARIIGSVDDGDGVQAMIVEINGSTERPDGNTFHITWSLDRTRGLNPSDSNAVIRENDWLLFAKPVKINIHPAQL